MSTVSTSIALGPAAYDKQNSAHAHRWDDRIAARVKLQTKSGYPVSASQVSKYGYGSIDVRASYGHLPCQFFWTWLTGKALRTGNPRNPRETLLTPLTLSLQLCWSWSVIIASIYMATHFHSVVLSFLAIILVMNRTRGLLHTFHYTSHGGSLADMKLARFMGKYFMSLPILHTTWNEYLKIHARDHHGYMSICTESDPDQQFVVEHKFKPRMTKREFWYAVCVEPLLPKHIWAHFWFRFRHNFIVPGWGERAPRILYWVTLFSAATYFHIWPQFALYFLFPLLIVTQFSSYIQHVTEHLWFPPADNPESVFEHVASLTWGRFLGRPYPMRENSPNLLVHLGRLLIWWLKIFVIDLPCRLFVFMQDLSSHDFHHRSPKVNFWSITRERANTEVRPGRWGPMTETWSVAESMLVLRDHLVHGESHPFFYPVEDCTQPPSQFKPALTG